MRSIITAAITAGLALSAPAHSAGFIDPALIDVRVAQFTGAATGTPGGARLPVDRRLKLAGCAAPLALEWYGQRRDTVLVRCPETGGWRIYVPVESGPAAAARQQAVVSKGENVSIVLRGQGFTLSRQGEALEAGGVGEWIRVRPAAAPPASRGTAPEPIRAQVLRPGMVGMDLP